MHDDSLREALDKIEILDFLESEGVEFRGTRGSSGDQLNVKTCPECGTAKWKVFLNKESGIGNCFSGSCEAKFNVYKFVRAQLSLSDKQTVAYIKTQAAARGWRPKKPAERTTASVVGTADLVLPTSYEIPIGGKDNLVYLQNRGITVDVAKAYHLRFCHLGWFNYMADGQKRGQCYDNRILIPVYDLEGKMVSFQGRDIIGTAEKKYLFPPGFASTGKHLFNGQNAVGKRSIVMGEGAFDVMAIDIALADDPNLAHVVAVGSFGKSLSSGPDSQLERLKQLKACGLQEVVLMWDGEVQATDDAIKACRAIIGIGLKARLAALPFAKDPNEVAGAVVHEAFYRAPFFTEMVAVQMMIRRRREAQSHRDSKSA